MTFFFAQGDRPAGSHGEIIVAPHAPALECRVVSLSAAGATLVVPVGTVVPDAITLAVAGEFVMRRCQVVWQQPGRVGVAFELPA